ncbi:TetR family transcriptional regulator [Pseudodesulfovibrio sp. JC047]|uniref:TetR/AcrR family transcriptional regulator n=1 Tax=Pseudodesulfovibrio sp. JC047 TaxID=2683199 RepID=UPI0013D1C7A1|nr:TetR/AcrR family transcriptional regulator [Pseudodesulfovibrio sp. JC047]NDV18386.1 TetR family transcriptional regulator [Pseudodesulfovibrio sp. JC047]
MTKEMKTSKDRAKLKQQRIIKFFIDSANEIIKQDGVGAVTIRKAADLAGYTSATLYNYFDNLQHLVFLATMTYLEEYNAALPRYLKGSKNSIERYMLVCKCFAEFSFSDPEIYELLFFTHSDEKLEEYTKQYYDLFPERIVKDWPAPLNKIYVLNSIYSRSYMMLDDCIQEGFITPEKAQDFNDVNLRIYKTILQDVQEGELTKKEAISKTMKYYFQLMEYYMEPDALPLLKQVKQKLQ